MVEQELDDLKEEAKGKLPEYAYPAYWVTLEKMPTKGGESRKLDRQALPKVDRAAARGGGGGGVEDGAASPAAGGRGGAAGRTEQVISKVWCEVLGASSIGAPAPPYLFCASACAARSLKRRGSTPGHAIAAVRAL